MGGDFAAFAFGEDVIAIVPHHPRANVPGVDRAVLADIPGFSQVAHRLARLDAEEHAVDIGDGVEGPVMRGGVGVHLQEGINANGEGAALLRAVAIGGGRRQRQRQYEYQREKD